MNESEIIPMLILKGRGTFRKEYSRKAIAELSKELRKRAFEKLYVADLDGIERNRPQLDLVQELSDDFLMLYEAGPQRASNVIDMIVAGADIAYMNTFSIRSLEEVELALTLTDRVGLKIDWDKGYLGSGAGLEGSPLETVLSSAKGMGASDFVVPMEILDQSLRSIGGPDIIVRAIVDTPEDAMAVNKKVNSIIVNYDQLPGGDD